MREICHGAVEVGVEPTPICTATQDVSSVTVQNVSDVPVFVGSSRVSVDGPTRGLMINPGETTSVPSYQNDASTLFAVVADKEDRDEGDEAPSATVVFMTPH